MLLSSVSQRGTEVGVAWGGARKQCVATLTVSVNLGNPKPWMNSLLTISLASQMLKMLVSGQASSQQECVN